MIFEICATIATLVLIVLAVYIIQTLKEVQKSLKNMNRTLSVLEPEMAILQENLNKLVYSSTELMQKTSEKVTALDPLFQTFHSAGNALNSGIHSVRKESIQFLNEEDNLNVSKKILDIIELTKIGIKLYQQIKRRG